MIVFLDFVFLVVTNKVNEVNNRERFSKIMHFETVDHPPLIISDPWPATRVRWEAEGLPAGINIYDYFEIPRWDLKHIGIETVLWPPFEEVILEETGDYVIKINKRGVKEKNFRDAASMPEFLEYPIKGLESLGWLRKKLDPDTPGRAKDGWLDEAKRWQNDGAVVLCNGGMYFGFINEHMGTEKLMYAYFDNPELINEVNEMQCVLCERALQKALPKIKLDCIGYHEDMAYKNGSMISTEMFREFMMPYYKRITKLTSQYGVDIHWLDSDGDIHKLIPLWLECGINYLMPMEVAAGMDVVELRKEFSHDLLMMGGFDKRILAASRQEIKAELERLRPLIEQGGYIIDIDHAIPPDVSLENLKFYVETLKSLYGMK